MFLYLAEENVGEYLRDLGAQKDFLDETSKIQVIRRTVENWTGKNYGFLFNEETQDKVIR